MLPILISRSFAPTSYFFWAAAGEAASASAPASDSHSQCRLFFMTFSLFRALAAHASEPAGEKPHKPRHAGRHHVNDEQQNDTIDRASQALRDALGDVRHEQHE